MTGVQFPAGAGFFSPCHPSRPAPGPTHPPIQWVLGAVSPGVKRLGRDAKHSPPSSAEVKNVGSYTCTPQYIVMVWYLVKHKDNYVLRFIY
jgi:hypothetical protein